MSNFWFVISGRAGSCRGSPIRRPSDDRLVHAGPSVIRAFGSSGACNSNVPGPISMAAPSSPSRTAATSAAVLSTDVPAFVGKGIKANTNSTAADRIVNTVSVAKDVSCT